MALKKLIGLSILWRGLYFATALLSNILISKYLQAALSGSVLYVANFFSLLALILGLGFDSGITFFASKKLIPYNKLVFFALIWITLITIVGVLTKSYFLPLLLKDEALVLPGLRWYAVAFIAGVMMMNFFSSLFYSKGNFSLPSSLYSLINIIVIITVISNNNHTVQNTKLIVDLYFYSTFIQGAILIPAFLFAYKQPLSGLALSSQSIKHLAKFSVLSLGANIIFFLISRVDFFFVNKYCSASDLGNYIQVARLGQLLLFFPQVIASVVFPQSSAKADNLSIANTTLFIGRLMGVFYATIFIITFTTGKWVFPLIFGSSFNIMRNLLLIYLPGFFSLSYLTLISAFFLGNGHLKINIVGTLLALLIVIVGDMLVVKIWGVIAAAWVGTLAYTCNFIYSAFKFRKKYKFSNAELYKLNKKDLITIKNLFSVYRNS